MNPKQKAAEAALAYLHSGMVVGLGTGSTADYFLQALGAALKDGRLKDIRGVPTSRKSEQRGHHLGIPIATLAESPVCEVCVDGADEVDPQLDLVKGLGGALLREKVVAQNSKKFVVVADGSKKVPKLGTKGPLPVEVTQFAHEATERFLRSLGCTPTLRKTPEGGVFITDNNNVIYDCKFDRGIDDARALEQQLKGRAGVVETGLFLKMADVVLIAADEGLETLERKR